MSINEPQLAALEMQSLETHVAVNHERFKKLDESIGRLETLVERQTLDTKEQFTELKKIVVWASSTLFGTLLIALLTSVFKVI
ncbi:hypothetical protein N9I00_00745 [bacterium]|jgi:hypothetical protein|nr:hypothetical protein [bacterium]MDA9993077.1 hypothetical protein [bacterium]